MQQLKSLAVLICVLLMPHHVLAAPANAQPLEDVPPPPKIADAKKVPKDLSRYVNFLHPWMHEILNQLVLMLMFGMLVIATLIVLRMQDIG